MAKYIDAENTTELPWLREAFPLLENFYLIPKDTPAADVQEVKHGEWVRVSDDDQYEGCYFCSECKEEYFNPSDDENMLPNFCPNCGAKMDGGKNER